MKNVLLVHNGSQPRFINELQIRFPLITHIILEKNKGYSGGANHGLRQAFSQSPWALFITNDCELLSWPRIPKEPAIVAPQIHARKMGRVDSLGGRLIVNRARPVHCKSVEEFTNSKNQKKYLPYIPGSAFLMHQNIFEATNGFNESLGTYWEDISLSVNAYRMGFSLLVDPQLELLHKVGKTCHKDSHYTTYLYQRNRQIISRQLVSGNWNRLILEFTLWTSWIRMGFHLIKKKRFTDFSKLLSAIAAKKTHE